YGGPSKRPGWMNLENVVGIAWIYSAFPVTFIPDTEVPCKGHWLSAKLVKSSGTVSLIRVGKLSNNPPSRIIGICRIGNGHIRCCDPDIVVCDPDVQFAVGTPAGDIVNVARPAEFVRR